MPSLPIQELLETLELLVTQTQAYQRAFNEAQDLVASATISRQMNSNLHV
jgi:hypothetical protein